MYGRATACILGEEMIRFIIGITHHLCALRRGGGAHLADTQAPVVVGICRQEHIVLEHLIQPARLIIGVGTALPVSGNIACGIGGDGDAVTGGQAVGSQAVGVTAPSIGEEVGGFLFLKKRGRNIVRTDPVILFFADQSE